MTSIKTFLASVALGSWAHVTSGLQTGERFHMYAYYPVDIPWDVSGLPVFYQRGRAVVASYETASKHEDLVPIEFIVDSAVTDNGDDVTIIAAEVDITAPIPNAATTNPPFQNATLFRPSDDAVSRVVGFLTNADDILNIEGLETRGFVWSDGLFLWTGQDGAVQSGSGGYWLARTENNQIFELNWGGGESVVGDGIRVDMRKEAAW